MSHICPCELLEISQTCPAVVFPAGRVVKRLKQEDGERLREATIQLLEQQQNICGLLREVQVSQGGLRVSRQLAELSRRRRDLY